MLNIYQINPAFAGLSDKLNVFTSYRTQWQDHTGSPTQLNLNATMPFYKLSGGLGILLNSSFQGATTASEFGASYSYFLPYFSNQLSVGVYAGLGQMVLHGDKIITPEGSYQNNINHNDPILTNNRNVAFYPKYSLSLFYAHDFFDAGIRFSDLFAQNINLENIPNYNSSRFTDLFGIYYYTLPNGWILQPSVYLMTNFKQYQFEISNFIKYGNVFGGIGLRGYDNRSVESVNLAGGIKFNNVYTISYSYDVSLNRLRQTSEGSHEIMIRYDLNTEINTGRPPKVFYNPRNL